MSYEFVPLVPQGWQCPVCGAVYSPSTPMCYNCNGNKKSYTVSSGTYVATNLEEYKKQLDENEISKSE